MSEPIQTMLNNLRADGALVHNITNYVTVNDCANILLACGASPIMADAVEEVAEITALCSGLNINIGTLNSRTVEAMILAGKKANALGKPVLLDPVGVGASALRTDTANQLLASIQFRVIRGNISEIKTLAKGFGTTQGVDAGAEDAVTEATMADTVTFLKDFALKTGAVVVVTGARDILTDGTKVYVVDNGHPMMAKVTGTGCMLSAMMTAFISANETAPLTAALAAVTAMGLAGELAYEKIQSLGLGNASYRNLIIDQICLMDGDLLARKAKVTRYAE